MAVKTITVTKTAYDALKAMKSANESFSEMILRISKRKPLSAFFGVISKETGERMERAIADSRRARDLDHLKRVKEIARALKG
jgi:predicted CopG family antitoxin